ncbi:hypothetical protein NC651_029025 [Populus alba x Populus x berolinensis]|nr:hypothetical protein NC651_029025 [Populus alba x Populus x berolinensis]
MAFQVTTSLFGIESKTLLADIKSPHLPYMSIKADPTYEFTSIFFPKTNPSTHLPKTKSPKSPHAPRTLTNVISSGSNPSSVISINKPIASLAKPILEYPEIIEFQDTKSLPPISSNTFRAKPISPHLAYMVIKE